MLEEWQRPLGVEAKQRLPPSPCLSVSLRSAWSRFPSQHPFLCALSSSSAAAAAALISNWSKHTPEGSVTPLRFNIFSSGLTFCTMSDWRDLPILPGEAHHGRVSSHRHGRHLFFSYNLAEGRNVSFDRRRRFCSSIPKSHDNTTVSQC